MIHEFNISVQHNYCRTESGITFEPEAIEVCLINLPLRTSAVEDSDCGRLLEIDVLTDGIDGICQILSCRPSPTFKEPTDRNVIRIIDCFGPFGNINHPLL